MCVRTKLTVFFDDPFWVGVFERVCGGRMEVAKVVFGSEPKDWEVYGFVLNSWARLHFGPPVAADRVPKANANPKRVRRQVSRELAQKGVGTKAQMAMKLQQEEGKIQNRQENKRKRDAEARCRFEMKQAKKKRKHRGR